MGKILVVEDEVNIRGGIVRMVNNIDASLEVYETGAAKEALRMARENIVDVFILDIQLEDYSGLELAKQLRDIDTYKLTPIIFISGAISKEFEAYRQIHCYSFIEKPFKEIDIKQALETIISHGIKKEERFLRLKLKYKNCSYIIKEKEIIFIERKNRKLLIKTIYQDITHSASSLSKIQEQLSKNLVQCHQGFVINRAFVQEIDHVNNLVYLKNIGQAIPIGRIFKKGFCESMNVYESEIIRIVK